jgi:hypothetical protein
MGITGLLRVRSLRAVGFADSISALSPGPKIGLGKRYIRNLYDYGEYVVAFDKDTGGWFIRDLNRKYCDHDPLVPRRRK